MTRNFSVSPLYRDIGGWLILAVATAGIIGLLPPYEKAARRPEKANCPSAGASREVRCWITWRYGAVTAGEQLASAATPICICSENRGES